MSRKALLITLSILAIIFLFLVCIGMYNTDGVINNRINLVLSSIGSFATVITLVTVFLPKSRFKGIVTCWDSKKPKAFDGEENLSIMYDLLSFRIVNKGKVTLSNVQITCKIPLLAVNQFGYKEQGIRARKVKESCYTSLITPVILGTSRGDNEHIIEHYIAIQRWNKGNIYVSISADQISVTTFCLKLEKKSELKATTFTRVIDLTK